MARSDHLCTQEEVHQMVHQFYDRVRVDDTLGPIFNAHIQDWDPHLEAMVRFWSSLLLGAGTYNGTPMPKHVALPQLSADLFRHWLVLFRQTTEALGNDELAKRANEYAQRIARSLWFGYQMHNAPNSAPKDLLNG